MNNIELKKFLRETLDTEEALYKFGISAFKYALKDEPSALSHCLIFFGNYAEDCAKNSRLQDMEGYINAARRDIKEFEELDAKYKADQLEAAQQFEE